MKLRLDWWTDTGILRETTSKLTVIPDLDPEFTSCCSSCSCCVSWRSSSPDSLWQRLSKRPSDLSGTSLKRSVDPSVCPLAEHLRLWRQSLLLAVAGSAPPWICNYWWLHIRSELLQSARMVIVKEVICIKLIIRRNKAHKSGQYQFSWKCFRPLSSAGSGGKKDEDSPFSENQGSNQSEDKEASGTKLLLSHDHKFIYVWSQRRVSRCHSSVCFLRFVCFWRSDAEITDFRC